jgi:hypothetical protein
LQPCLLMSAGGSSARLEYVVWDHGVAGSNPVLPTLEKIKFHQNLQINYLKVFYAHSISKKHKENQNSGELSGESKLNMNKAYLQLISQVW